LIDSKALTKLSIEAYAGEGAVMKYLVSMMFLVASAAHAVDAAGGGAVGQGECKVVVTNVGESMPTGIYQGQCVNDKPNGAGEVVFNNGDYFIGSFKNGRIDGKGKWTSGSSGNSYSGSWRDGKREGVGTYSWPRSNQQYVGAWVDDKREGQGKLTWGNGDRFEGEFRNNEQYTGTYYTAGGEAHTCSMGSCR
jgi:hypothetical protein